MIEKIKNWWNRDKKEKQALLATVEALRQHNDEISNTLKRVTDQLQIETARASTPEPEVSVYDSSEPWVEIKSEGVNDVKGLYLQLDWNDAFIEYLKDRGLKAADEEALVQKWLAMLYQDMTERMEVDAIERKSNNNSSYFE